MNLKDPTTLNEFMAHVEAEWNDQDPALPGWIEQTDDEGGRRVLLGSARDITFAGKRLRVFRVKMSSHPAGPIHYVFGLKGSGETIGRTAHYVLSHQRSTTWREWFCETTRGSTPHLGTYRGDLSLVGTRFRELADA